MDKKNKQLPLLTEVAIVRINPSKGHTKDNVVLACHAVEILSEAGYSLPEIRSFFNEVIRTNGAVKMTCPM